MKKNKGLVIGIIIVVILLAVAAWYFFFRTPTAAKLDTEVTDPEPTPGPLDQFVCPTGTTGTYPNCVVAGSNTVEVFTNAIAQAKLKVAGNSALNSIQKINATKIINAYPFPSSGVALGVPGGPSSPSDTDRILQAAANGKDIVQLILIDAEMKYESIYGVKVCLSDGCRAAGGRG